MCCEAAYIETVGHVHPRHEIFYTTGNAHDFHEADKYEEDCEQYKSWRQRRRCRKAQYNKRHDPDEDPHLFKKWEPHKRSNPIWYVLIFFGVVLIGLAILMVVK